MKRAVWLSIIALFAILVGCAEKKVNVSVACVDNDGNPVSGMKVVLLDLKGGSELSAGTSNEDGVVTFKDVPAKSMNLQLKTKGWRVESKDGLSGPDIAAAQQGDTLMATLSVSKQ